MPIPVVCSCSAKLKVGDHLQGKQIKCPKCGALIPVGTTNGKEPAAPAKRPAAAAPKAPKKPAGTRDVLAQSDLSEEECEQITDKLEKGERLVWAGKPVARSAYLRGWFVSGGLFFGALITIGISIGIIIAGQTDGIGLLFVALPGLLGLGLLGAGFAWPFLAQRRAEQTLYAFTDQRALAWVPGFLLFGGTKFEAFNPAQLSGLFLRNVGGGADGVGDLVFGTRVHTRQTSEGWEYAGFTVLGFFLIRHAEKVERMMREELIDPYTDKLYE